MSLARLRHRRFYSLTELNALITTDDDDDDAAA